MRRPSRFVILAAMATCLGASGESPSVRAEDGPKPVDPAKSREFDLRMFKAPIGKDKAYACFVHRYDADHLARHPLQKVSGMKLLATAENPPDDKAYAYSFRLGVKYRTRKGNFESSGFCSHVMTEQKDDEVRLGCGVDCDGGGIEVALSRDDKSAIVRLEHVRIWLGNSHDDDKEEELVAGQDDKIFRLDRADITECKSLITDRKELAAIRHK
jgi:hypothetical protein